MAEAKNKKPQNQNPADDPPFAVYLPPLRLISPPTPETTFFFKGFDAVLEKYKDIDTEREVRQGLENLKAHMQLKPSPEKPPYISLSPVTPEDANKATVEYVNLVDSTALALVIGLIAAEAASLGQLDQTLAQIMRLPVVEGALSIASKVHSATFMEGIYPAYRHYILKQYQPLRAPEEAVIRNYLQGFLDWAGFLSQMEYLGYDTEEAVKLARSAFQGPGIGLVLDMLRRGIINDSFATFLLARQNIPSWEAPYILQLRWQIPGYQDIIGIYMREGYQPEKWVEIPQEFIGYMKQLGYSEEWAKRIWGKHWVLPSIELLYEMYWKKIIDHDTLVQMLKYHDYEPVWRERLIENAYRPIPRVDLRRAYRYGRLKASDLRERYEWLGFKPSDAQIMADIAQRESLDRYYARLETVARAAYRKGKLSREDFITILRRINTPEEAIPLIIEAEEIAKAAQVLEPAEEPRALTVGQILALYKNQIISRDEAYQRLLGAGFESIDAELLLRLNAPEPPPPPPKTPAELRAEMVSRPRIASPEDWLRAYRNGLISPTRLLQRLMEMGYDFKDSVFLIQLYSRTLGPEDWLRAYKNGITDAATVTNKLLGMGYSPEEAAILIQLYTPKPERAEINTELINEAAKHYREGLMTREIFMAYLRRAGLTEEEIQAKIEVEDLRYRYDFIMDLIALAREAYRKDVFTAEEFLARLLYYGMQLERAQALVALEELRKLPKPKAS